VRIADQRGVFIEPGCPWQNPFVESFHSRVRDELLNGEQFAGAVFKDGEPIIEEDIDNNSIDKKVAV